MNKRDDTTLEDKKRMYADIFIKPGGKYLMAWLIEQRDNLRDKAERSNDPDESYGFTKEAKGINITIEHIKAMKRDE